jgi:hypothetical protein
MRDGLIVDDTPSARWQQAQAALIGTAPVHLEDGVGAGVDGDGPWNTEPDSPEEPDLGRLNKELTL